MIELLLPLRHDMASSIVCLLMMLSVLEGIDNVESQCPGLPDVPHAAPNITNATDLAPFSDGTVLEFTCHDGYRESGTDAMYTCNGSSWFGGDYECNVIYCSSIDPPENGTITNSPNFAAGSSVIFSCNPGHVMNGTNVLTCATDGQWWPESPPTCSVKMWCPEFGEITNGKTFQAAPDGVENDYGSVVKVTCEDGYVLAGKTGVKCLDSGQWEAKPECLNLSCPPLAGVKSRCLDITQYYTSAKVYVLICSDASDTVSVTKIGSEHMDTVCMGDEWTQPEPACYCDCLMNTSIPYVSMFNLVNSKFLNHSDTLSWNCSGGATKATDDAVVCTDGRLSAEPFCTPPPTTTTPVRETVLSQCANLPNVPNATPDIQSSGPFNVGTAVKFTCDAGYRSSGTNPEYTCRGFSWVGGDYKCNFIYCSSIDAPENGQIINMPNFAANSSIEFMCNPGHDMNGASRLVCRTDGHWRPSSPPKCDIKLCSDFGDIANADTFQEVTGGVKNEYGSAVRVECNDGFVLNGKVRVRCLENGQWDEKPTCMKVPCPSVLGASSSCIESTKFHISTNTYILICNDDSATVSVTRIGSMVTKCEDNQWSQPEPACYCDCLMNTGAPYVSMSNLEKLKFLKHGAKLSWSCSGGATKGTNGTIVCNDGRLSEEPVCITIAATATQGITTNDESNSASAGEDTDRSSSVPSIVGGSVGAFVVLAILIALVAIIVRRRRFGLSVTKAAERISVDTDYDAGYLTPIKATGTAPTTHGDTHYESIPMDKVI